MGGNGIDPAGGPGADQGVRPTIVQKKVRGQVRDLPYLACGLEHELNYQLKNSRAAGGAGRGRGNRAEAGYVEATVSVAAEGGGSDAR